MSAKANCPSSLAQGDVLQLKSNEEKIYIVLKTGDGQRWTHLLDIEYEIPEARHKASPFALKTEEVLRRLADNVEHELALRMLPKLPISVAEQRRPARHVPHRRSVQSIDAVENPTKNAGWLLIEKLLTFDISYPKEGEKRKADLHGPQHEELLRRETRANRILRFIKIHPYSEARVRRVLRRFWQRGLSPAAADYDYHHCGGRGRHKNFKSKPGRKARQGCLSGPVMDLEARRLLQIASDYYFKPEYRKGKRQRKSMKMAVRWLELKLAKRRVFDKNRRLVDYETDFRTSFTARQLQYFIQQRYSYQERRAHVVGSKHYLLHERPLTGRLSDTRGPGERYHIDATVIDVYCVCRRMRSVAVPRPTLYLVVDDYSRTIVGVHLTFDPPSWKGAMAALCNALDSKVKFCEKLEIEITEGEWPRAPLPEEIFADQGEMSSVHRGMPISLHYSVQLSNAPAYRPDMRSIMECRFRILPRSWMPLVPGAVEKVSFERGQQHPALHAALTFDELYAIVVRAILDYNLRAVTGYPTPPEMVQRLLAPTPMNLWHFGMEVNGRGRSVDVDEFRLRVMKSEKAKIGPRGIEFAGLEYDCPLSLVERQSLKRAENKDTWVDVVGDTTDNSRIFLLGLGEPVECALAESVPDFLRGLSHEEVRAYKDFESWNRGVQEADGRKSTAITEYNIRELARDAETKTKQELVERGMDHPDISKLDEMRDFERQMGDVPANQSMQANECIETEKMQSLKTDERQKKNVRRQRRRDLKEFLAQQQAKASNDLDLDPEEETSVNVSSIAEESEAHVRNVFDSY